MIAAWLLLACGVVLLTVAAWLLLRRPAEEPKPSEFEIAVERMRDDLEAHFTAIATPLLPVLADFIERLNVTARSIGASLIKSTEQPRGTTDDGEA